MPGISDRDSLRTALLDSLVVSDTTDHRLNARNVKDITSAKRLRIFEKEICRIRAPSDYQDILSESKCTLVEGKSGNYYVYKFMLLVLKMGRDKDLCKELRGKDTVDSFLMLASLMQSKLPSAQYNNAVKNLPEGHGRVQARYIMLRTFLDRLSNSHSESGRYRGQLQAINVQNPQEQKFHEKISEWFKRHDENNDPSDSFVPEISKSKLAEHLSLTMIRLSDVIYINIIYLGDSYKFLFTSNHFDRALTFIRQYTNIEMGLLLSYGMEDHALGEEIVYVANSLIGMMARLGTQDDLAPGEAGKALTDLYKAKLSQTDELPWNNFHLLRKTYSEVREHNSMNLWEDFSTFRFDPDIMLNLTYVWKVCLQPDSDISKDFSDLVEGLSKPNPIDSSASEIMTCAFRRSLLVGALKEGRQVCIHSENMDKVPLEVKRATTASTVTDQDLRSITFGMMKDITVTLYHVFPDPKDLSHLAFKDKSSSTDDIRIRSQIAYMEATGIEIKSLEDEVILTNAAEMSERFFSQLKFPCTREVIDGVLKTTANDILTSLDDSLSRIFKEADVKYNCIVKSLSRIDEHYEKSSFRDMLVDWAETNPDLLINTATEPKLGEVHKRSVRIFYMFEKGMKTFLSQFERMSRVMDYYIKGAEIVKGDRSREKHMNVLSSAHHSSENGMLSYQILFDLSKFSQKFNHRIIDAAAKVIGEVTEYPAYASISHLFKAAFLYVSARNVNRHFVGVLGAFEGFLNFLWTGIHATVMDIALKECGRSGDLAAYSDDGLLMFALRSNLSSPVPVIQEELIEIISSITRTYKDYGLDFNLGKTMISRILTEFLGVIQYKGKRLPTWMKELSQLGVSENVKIVSSVAQELNDTASQYSAMIKASMPPFAATYVGYLEILNTPGRRVRNASKQVLTKLLENTNIKTPKEFKSLLMSSFYCLNGSFGGVRLPDPISAMTTADFDPISEMLQDITQLSELFPEATRLFSMIKESVKPTEDYLKVLLGSYPLNTDCPNYGPDIVRQGILRKLATKFTSDVRHPLDRRSVPDLHKALEEIDQLYLPTLTSLVRYAVPVIEHDRMMAPTKSSALARLLRKGQIRSVQSLDTRRLKEALTHIAKSLLVDEGTQIFSSNELYSKSYPKLSFSNSIPSYRRIGVLTMKKTSTSYHVRMSPNARTDNKGTFRLLNRSYEDELVPPLVTTDVNVKHLSNAPDLASHCMRGLYSEVISAAAQGHDITIIADRICDINRGGYVPASLITHMNDLRKIAVANRKKSVHRVFGGMPSKSSLDLIRSGTLNKVMSIATDAHYSLIVTVALAHAHFHLTTIRAKEKFSDFYVHIDSDLAYHTKLHKMKLKSGMSPLDYRTAYADSTRVFDEPPSSLSLSVVNECKRAIDQVKCEIQDSLITGRMGMLSDIRALTKGTTMADPLRYAMVWSLVSKLDSVAGKSNAYAGVSSARTEIYSTDNIPVDLIDMAIVYRAYKEVSKSALGKYVKSGGEEPLLGESVANETIAASDELGLVTSMDVVKLRSKESAEMYSAIINAEGIHMVYYALDSDSETDLSDSISQSRAKAMGRVIDSLITWMFVGKKHEPDVDLKRLSLMIIRGSIRSSVHRSTPYNPRVVSSWMKYIFNTIKEFVELLPRRYKIPTEESHYKCCLTCGPELVELFEKMLRSNNKPKIGSLSTMDQAIKYLRKLVSYGALPMIDFKRAENQPSTIYFHLLYQYIRPSLTFVRTISYSTLSDAISRTRLKLVDPTNGVYDMETVIGEYINTHAPGATLETLLSAEPEVKYRIGQGELHSLELTIASNVITPYYMAASLIYSLSLPLLLARGRSSFTSVTDLSIHSLHSNKEDFESVLSSYSLPINKKANGYGLYIIRSMSELDILKTMTVLQTNIDDEIMLAIEIPPRASLVSLGLIQKLTSEKFSYVCPAMSSDQQGVSIYVIAIVDMEFWKIPVSSPITRDLTLNLGWLSLMSCHYELVHGNMDLISSISIVPYHQAGLPVFGTVNVDGVIKDIDTEEELVDKTRVSFIESSKPSDTTLTYAKLDPYKVMHIARAMRYKNSDLDPYLAFLCSSAHYYHALSPETPVESYAEFFDTVVSEAPDIAGQYLVVRQIFDPIVSLNFVDLSSLPAHVQMAETLIPTLELDNIEYTDTIDSMIRPNLNVYGKSMLEDDEKGKVIRYIQQANGELNSTDLYKIIKPPDVAKKKKFSGKIALNPNKVPKETYGLTAMSSSPAVRIGIAPKALDPPKIGPTDLSKVFAADVGATSRERCGDLEEIIESTSDQLIKKLVTIGFFPQDVQFLESIEHDVLEEAIGLSDEDLFCWFTDLSMDMGKRSSGYSGVI